MPNLDRIHTVLTYCLIGAIVGTPIVVVARLLWPALPFWLDFVPPGIALPLFVADNWLGAQRTLDSVRISMESKLDAVRLTIDTKIESLLELLGVHASIAKLASTTDAHPLVNEYLDWLSNRYQELLDGATKGELLAQDPDYFRFAEMIFQHAKTGICSTSLVDPLWYESPRCREYIKMQTELIKKGISFTRYFIVGRVDTLERRLKTVKTLKQQVQEGFNIVVVLRDNYQREMDAALIDGGALAMEASVPREGVLPEAQIIGCLCLLKVAASSDRVNVIKGYFDKLDSQQLVRFSGSKLDPTLVNKLEQAYLDQA